ncbi:MAG: glycosyltransferase family 2 protein, partial [Bacteroidales bacterium]|nr:glycosyltransferase family 2 protein [Bacteroidales bacterium]
PSSLYLSIIIPLYNEAGVIETTLARLGDTLMPGFVERTEVIIVDDCSTDDSARLAEKSTPGAFATRLIRLPVNSGKGAAVAAGVRAAKGDTIIIQDADLELNPSDIPALLEKLHYGNLDLVSGTRFRTGIRYPGHALPATSLNRLISAVATRLTGRKISDLTCGYKVFRKSFYESLSLKENRFGFETELMLRAMQDRGIAYDEADVTYSPRRKDEGKKIRISDGLGIIARVFRYGLSYRSWMSALTIAFIVTFMTVNMLVVKHWKDEQRVIEWDAISYYAYLPAAFIHHDLSLSFADGYDGPHKLIVWPERGPEGTYVIKTTMGLSLIWIPFFLSGHVAALISGADAGGYSEPYKFFLLVSALVFLSVGMIYLRRILLVHASDRITALVLASFAFGTNLYWYTLFQGTMAHVYNFALISAFIWYSMSWYDPDSGKSGAVRPSRRGGGMAYAKNKVRNSRAAEEMTAGWQKTWPAIRLGLILGLITLIRPTNILIIIFFLLYGITSWETLRQRTRGLASGYRYLILMCLAIIVVWLPQMIYWKEMTGQWLYFSYGSDERFFFGDPAIIKGLFSWRKGLFVYTPLLLFSFAGIFILWVRRSPHALAVTLFVPLNIYIILSWWCWWYGGGFGQRAFIDSYALMAVATAALLSVLLTVAGRWLKPLILCIFLLLMSLGIFNNFQYYYGAIHWDSMTKEAYLDSFGRVRPSANFHELLDAPDYDKAKEGANR